jgi:hypothetical protein
MGSTSLPFPPKGKGREEHPDLSPFECLLRAFRLHEDNCVKFVSVREIFDP